MQVPRVITSAVVGAAAAGVGLALGRWLSRPHAILRLRLRAAYALRRLILSRVRVPVALLPSGTQASLPSPDAEGLVLCDVRICRGRIDEVTPPGASAGAFACRVEAMAPSCCRAGRMPTRIW